MGTPWEQRKLGEEIFFSGIRNKGNLPYPSFSITNDRGFVPQSEMHDKFGYMESADTSAYMIVTPKSFAYNPARINVGSIGYYDGDDTVIVSSLYEVFKTKKNLLDEFLLLWLKSPKLKYWIDKLQEGSVRQYFYFDKLCECHIEIPTVAEQYKISYLFGQLNEGITLHQRKLELLKKKKAGLLQKMFPKPGSNVPELRFPGFTEPWEQRKLGELGFTFSGLSGKSKEDFGHGDASFITYLNVFSNPIADPSGLEHIEIDPKQHSVKEGDILFTTSSETPDEVGMSSIWPIDKENIYLNSFCFGFRPFEKIDINFYASLLRSPTIRANIILLAQGVSRYNISKNKVMEILLPLPDCDEQNKIGMLFAALENQITLHQRKLDILKEQKKGLLQKMFPKEGENEPELRFPEFR